MYIEPSTTIKLMQGCPLEPNHDHSIWFASLSDQTTFFNSLIIPGGVITNNYYARKSRGVIRVQLPISAVSKCNYMAFNNSLFENKWFYAFVKSVEYVNNITTELTFEIDNVQTWFFEMELGECFIEREHVTDDEFGHNIIEEGLETGEFVLSEKGMKNAPYSAGDYKVVAVVGTNLEPDTSGKYYCIMGNIFSGIDFKEFTNPSDAYKYLKAVNERKESETVISVFMVPSIFKVSQYRAPDFTPILQNQKIDVPFTTPYSIGFKYFQRRPGGIYVPKNNKVFTSDYSGIIAATESGESMSYGYEFFHDPENPVFTIEFVPSAAPQTNLYPRDYMGKLDQSQYDSGNRLYKLVDTNFPQCAYATDTFRAWLAQNSASISESITSGVRTVGRSLISGAASVASGQQMAAQRSGGRGYNPTGAIARTAEGVDAGVDRVFATLATIKDKKVAPPTIHGVSSCYAGYSGGRPGYTFYTYKISAEYAEKIDNYFSVYGYRVNAFKKPNIHARKNWSYVKTKGCVVRGSIPADVAEEITSIFDRGITFWTNGNSVGKYGDFDNPIL